jgi:chromate transporter
VTEPSQRPTLAALFLVFFRIGLLSFGGGLSGWVFREVVVLRRWLDEDEFMSGLAMSQILPGANITNLAVYIGQKLFGLRGAVVTFLALLCGPFFAVIALASVYGLINSLPLVQTAMDGVAAAAIGLLLIVAGRGVQRASRHVASLAALLATFIGVAFLHISLLLVVVVVGPLSVWAAWKRSAGDEG